MTVLCLQLGETTVNNWTKLATNQTGNQSTHGQSIPRQGQNFFFTAQEQNLTGAVIITTPIKTIEKIFVNEARAYSH